MLSHRFPLLACSLALSACAAHPAVNARSAVADGPQAMVFDESPAPAARPANPYAPTRSAKGSEYLWQNSTPPKCAVAPSNAPPVVLSFNGSVGVFPLLSDAELANPERPRTGEALDTWGNGEPTEAERRAGTPEYVVAALRPRFRQCFSHWVEAKTNAEGSVRFALELGCTGNVQSISAAVQGVDEPTLECLFTVMAPAQFSAPTGGHASLQVPVVFKNGGGR